MIASTRANSAPITLSTIAAVSMLLSTVPAASANQCDMDGRYPRDAIFASWYGQKHQGHRTASGERFDKTRFTAAHPSLPFHSQIDVTNLLNGKTVRLTVTDRLPGNDIDLDVSEAASWALGMRGCGVVPVVISMVR
jgi:rare lipoprotein A (peptidoglycan hydrolase)